MKGTNERRLRELEANEERGRNHFPQFTVMLMRTYATDEELAEWEAAGFPPITRAQFEAAVEQMYDEKLDAEHFDI